MRVMAMSTAGLVWLLITVLLILPLLLGYVLSWFITENLYKGFFTRKKDAPHLRACSDPSNQTQVLMFDEGVKFLQGEKALTKDVRIVNEGLNLKGIFLDYGSKKTIVISPGRIETSSYSGYYAIPLKGQGFNLLLVDPRASGESDGEYLTVGIKESQDLIKWVQFAHDELKQEEIILYGICIGGATSLVAMGDEKCPSYVKGAIIEASYLNFKKMFANHVKAEGHPHLTVTSELPYFFKKFAGVDIKQTTPEKSIQNVHQRILFIQGEKDVYVHKEDVMTLYDNCPSTQKEIKYIPVGEHSKLRLAAKEEYDQAVFTFLQGF